MAEKEEKNPQIDLDRLKRLLEEKGWKAPELAQYAKINYDTAYAIVSGRRTNPSSKNLTKIATALGCTSDYLLGRTDKRYPPTDQLPEQVRELAKIAGRLSETRQEELIKIAESLEELEREQPVYTISAQAMADLLQIVERLQKDDDNSEMYESLHELLRGAPPRLISWRPSEDGGKSAEN